MKIDKSIIVALKEKWEAEAETLQELIEKIEKRLDPDERPADAQESETDKIGRLQARHEIERELVDAQARRSATLEKAEDLRTMLDLFEPFG